MASFDENGKYIKTNWKAGDKITATKLNKIEESIEAVNDNDISRHVEADARLDALEAKDVAHDKELTNIKNTIADNKAAAELGDYDINSRMTFLEDELEEAVAEVNNVASTVDGKIATAEANMTAQVNQGKADMEAMVAEVEADLEGLSEQLVDIAIVVSTESELIKAINESNDGDVILVGKNIIVNNTIEINKRITLKGNIVAKMNSDEVFNIKYNGVGDLFKVGANWNECIFDNLTLIGNKDNTQAAIKLSGNKSKIVNCNIMNFTKAIEFYHYYDCDWTGENFIRNNFIEGCGIGIFIDKDNTNGSTYDSYIENNIILDCEKWIYAEKLHNWRIDNNHFYSKKNQTESRIFIDSIENTSITNNYIEVESSCSNLIEINVKTAIGGNQIINNRIFSPQYELIEQDIHVFKINVLSWCENLIISGNTLATNVTQNNIYLCYLTNSDNPCYATICNNSFPKTNIVKSNRSNWYDEVRIQHSSYNLRLSQGIMLNDFDDSKCLITSHSNFNDMLSETTKGMHITTDNGNIYYFDGSSFNEIVSNKNDVELEVKNNWVSNGDNKATKHGRRVFIEFDLVNGVNNENTHIFTIPSSHKPLKGKTVIANCYKEGDVIDKVELYVGSDGYVYLWKCNNAKRVLGEFSYFI